MPVRWREADHAYGSGGAGPLATDDAAGSGAARKGTGQDALYATVAMPPRDDLLARVMVRMLPKWIVGYHKSEDLLEGEEDLDPDEVRLGVACAPARVAVCGFHTRACHRVWLAYPRLSAHTVASRAAHVFATSATGQGRLG